MIKVFGKYIYNFKFTYKGKLKILYTSEKGLQEFPLTIPGLFAVVTSATISLTLGLLDFVEEDGPYCSIAVNGKNGYIIFIVFYIPWAIATICNFFCIWKAEKVIKSKCRKETYKDHIRVLRSYPICLLASYFLIFIVRILENLHIETNGVLESALVMMLLHGFFGGTATWVSIYRYKVYIVESSDSALEQFSMRLKDDTSILTK